MKKTIFNGSGVALVTPMNQDGSINYKTLKNLIEFQIQNKTDAIIICGTTGESATLNDDEQQELIKFTVDTAKNRIPIIAGTGSNNTRHALKLSLNAQKAGANALLIVTPYYNKTSQKGLIKHYNYIADNINLPIILYNVPSRTSFNILPETYLELSKHPNIVAVKEANSNISSIIETISLCKNNIHIYSGNDDQIVPILSLGGKGVISVLANICPKEVHNICYEYFNNNIEQSVHTQIKYYELIKCLFCDINPIPVKKALNMLGFSCGECRLPLDVMSTKNVENLKIIMQKFNII